MSKASRTPFQKPFGHGVMRGAVWFLLDITRRMERSLDRAYGRLSDKRIPAHAPLILKDALKAAQSLPQLAWPSETNENIDNDSDQ